MTSNRPPIGRTLLEMAQVVVFLGTVFALGFAAYCMALPDVEAADVARMLFIWATGGVLFLLVTGLLLRRRRTPRSP